MKLFLLVVFLAFTPFTAFAACMEVDNSFEAGMPSDGCPPGYAPLNDQTIKKAQQDTNALNALAAQGQANEQRNSDRALINWMLVRYRQLRPKCDFVEQHPIEARLKALADGKPASIVSLDIQKCHKLEAIVAQIPQAEQEEGITPASEPGSN